MMNKKQKFSLEDGTASVEMSASMLEGWIQVCKTPKAAIESAAKYYKLKRSGQKTDEERKEFAKLERIYDLVKDFSSSHRYLLEKEDFSQQDMDYIFALDKKEKTGLSNESLSGGKTSSAVYQSLLLEQVFKGMKERAGAFMEQNHIEETGDEDALSDWLDRELSDCIKNKSDVMTMIAKAMGKALGDPGRDALVGELEDFIKNRWISRLFTDAGEENKDELIIDTSSKPQGNHNKAQLLRNAYDAVTQDGNMVRYLDACVIRATMGQ